MRDGNERDHAYVQALAREGAEAPLVGGVLYLIWGLVIASAALVDFLAAAGVIAIPFVGGIGFWIGAFAIGWLATFAFGRRLIGRPGAFTVGNRTAAAKALGMSRATFYRRLLDHRIDPRE